MSITFEFVISVHVLWWSLFNLVVLIVTFSCYELLTLFHMELMTSCVTSDSSRRHDFFFIIMLLRTWPFSSDSDLTQLFYILQTSDFFYIWWWRLLCMSCVISLFFVWFGGVLCFCFFLSVTSHKIQRTYFYVTLVITKFVRWFYVYEIYWPLSLILS